MKRLLTVFLVSFLLIPSFPLVAENSDEPPVEPYDPIEFPPWTRDVRRAEIVMVGAFPIGMIVSGLFYEVGRFAWYSLEAGRADMEYAPWFLASSTGERYTNDERKGLIIAGIGVGSVIAIIDYFILNRNEHSR